MRFSRLVHLTPCIVLLVLAACAAPERYDYQAIRRERAARPSPEASPVPDTPPDATVATATDFSPVQAISLDEAVGIALENNPENAIAVARIRQAEARRERASAPWYPRLQAWTEYLQGDAPSAYLFKTIDQRLLPETLDFNNPGWFENWESGLRASYNLYRGGRDRLNRDIADIGLEVAHLDRQQVENVLVAAVIKAFYDAAAARRFIEISRQSERTVAAQLRIMNVRFRGGDVLKSDILSLEVRLAEAREDVVRSENRLANATTALADLMGLPAETELALKTEVSVPPAVPEDYAAGVGLALERRPEIRRAREEVRRARMAVDAVRSGYLPQVDLVGAYWADDPQMKYSRERENWTAALRLNWDIFDGFDTRAGTREAEALLDEKLAADRLARQRVRFEVRSAYLLAQEARARLKVTETVVDQAAESLNLVKRQYEGGSAGITRYLEAELARNLALTRITAARFDRQKATAEIARALGHWAGSPETGARDQ